MRKSILYNGIGTNGIGTKKNKFTYTEFMNIMDKEFMKRCPDYFLRKNNKNCSKVKQMNKQMVAKNNFNNMNTNKYKNVTKKCAKGISNKMFKCNMDQYLEFSGASKLPR
jgi:hypothetical protein